MSEPRSDAERIVVLLGENDDSTWEATTIAERLDLDADEVNSILSQLKERGLVCREGSNWRVTDDEERLRDAYRIHRYHEAADDRYDEERLEALRTDDMEDVS